MLRAALSALAALATLALTAPPLAQERVVNVYNWSDYIDPKVLESFTKETGIKVTYDTYDNNEIVETKLLAGKSGYDVVVPSGPFLQRLIQAGVFAKLDKGEAAEPQEHVARGDAAPPGLRPRQPVRRQLHVGHDRHRPQHAEGPPAPRQPGPQHLGPDAALGGDLEAQGLRRPDPRRAGGHLPERAQLARAQPRFEAPRRLEPRRRAALPHPRRGAEVPLLGVHQRPRQRRHLHGGRLLGRRAAGEEARRGGEERRRDRLRHPARGRADVVRTRSPSRPTPRTSTRRTPSSTT